MKLIGTMVACAFLAVFACALACSAWFWIVALAWYAATRVTCMHASVGKRAL